MKNKNSPDYINWIKTLEEEHYKCIRCGECRTICPVYRDDSKERYTARGKLAMIKALSTGELTFNDQVREAIDNCLLCSGCASRCSSEVQADKVIAATRRVFADELGINPIKKVLGVALGQPNGALRAEVLAGSLIQPLLFKKVPRSSGLYRRFALPFIDEKQYVPEIASTPLRRKIPFSGNQNQPVVRFFTGCMTNYAMTEIGESVIRVLNKLGWAVDLPGAQGCCGMPMVASGDSAAVRKQAGKNIRAFAENLDDDTPIVTACASCGHMLKHGYKDALRTHEDIMPALERISARTMDLSEFLVNRVGLDALRSKVRPNLPLREVSYHDPCHLRKAQRITEEPRALINLATGNGLRELADPDACCGMGGTYFLFHQDLSRRIQGKKQADALEAGGHPLVSACPGCMFQLRDGVSRSENPAREVLHLVQLLDEAML